MKPQAITRSLIRNMLVSGNLLISDVVLCRVDSRIRPDVPQGNTIFLIERNGSWMLVRIDSGFPDVERNANAMGMLELWPGLK